MPSSFVANIPEIVVLAADLRPRPHTILDVGVGLGKYGVLLREYLPAGRTIDGVEVWPAYLTWQRAVYDRIYEADVRDVLETLPRYDLILLVDILEHFEPAESVALLERLAELAGALIVSTPRELGELHAGPNPHELHRCVWTDDQLDDLADEHDWQLDTVPSSRSIIALIRP